MNKPLREEKGDFLFAYDATVSFQIQFCLTIILFVRTILTKITWLLSKQTQNAERILFTNEYALQVMELKEEKRKSRAKEKQVLSPCVELQNGP